MSELLTKSIQLRVSNSLFGMLKRRADDEGRSVTNLVRHIVVQDIMDTPDDDEDPIDLNGEFSAK